MHSQILPTALESALPPAIDICTLSNSFKKSFQIQSSQLIESEYSTQNEQIHYGDTTNNIEQLVSELSEIYQPIYGYPELSSHASRICEDRLASIIPIYRTLEAKLKRPLRVLDLGCAQGFFSFKLAELGATVLGVDLHTHNISLCKSLAKEHPDSKIHFEQAFIESVIARLEQDQYDLVLGLSVFHHIVRHHGIELSQKMLGILAEKTVAGIYEMALAIEPMSWSSLQPQNSRDLLQGYSFIHEFARHTHHLTRIWRPMYVASNRYWFLNGQTEPFHNWKSGSHTHASITNHKTRRYFFGHGHIVKLLTLNDKRINTINLQEHTNEVSFLMNPPDNFDVPRLLSYGQHQNEVWLVRECLEGELLHDMIMSRKQYNADHIICSTLEQLIKLETADLYHNDLRPANILVTPDGDARIIDFGSITQDKKDRSWPHNLFLSFMIYMYDVIHGQITTLNTERAAAFNPENFPDPYRRILWQLYTRAPEGWTFAALSDCFNVSERKNAEPTPAAQGTLQLIIKAMENACKIYQDAAACIMAQRNDFVAEK